MDYVVGVDLAQVRDYTAIAVVTFDEIRKEAVAIAEKLYRLSHKRVSEDELPEAHLERMPMGTPYPVVVRTCGASSTPPLQNNAELVVDATGMGAAVVEMLREAGLYFKSVIITSGEKEVRKHLSGTQA
jgi:hypothetical protein